jgi:hypothetical protein
MLRTLTPLYPPLDDHKSLNRENYPFADVRLEEDSGSRDRGDCPFPTATT